MNRFMPDRLAFYILAFLILILVIVTGAGEYGIAIEYICVIGIFYFLVVVFGDQRKVSRKDVYDEVMADVLSQIIKSNDKNYMMYMSIVEDIEKSLKRQGRAIGPESEPILHDLMEAFKGLRDHHYNNKMMATLKLTEHLHVKDELC